MKGKIQPTAISFPAVFKDMDMKKGIVTGYFSSFNTWDSDKEMIEPGSFTKTFLEQGPQSTQPRIKHLLNHDTDKPIGKPISLIEDAKGAAYESQIGSHDLGKDFLKMVDSGLITEHSFGGRVLRKEIINPEADWREQKTRLKEIQLWEFSCLTCWGANQWTPLTAVKDLKTIEARINNLLSAVKNGTFTDTTFEFLEHEILFLQKAFTDFNTSPGNTVDTTTPGTVKKGFADFLKQSNTNN